MTLEITLVTEGTYPHNFGGVSVWCDQLVRGMPEHRFNVLALTTTGAEPTVWDLPGHVTVEPVAMWGPPSGRPPSRGEARRFERLFRSFLYTVLSPSGRMADVFPHILRGLFDFGRTNDLGAALRTEGPVRWLMDAWNDQRARFDEVGVRPTVHDALTTIDLLEHMLRPLQGPPPRGDVVHAVSNGIPVLPCLAAKWTYGTPFCLTEHGIYLRERYIGMRRAQYPYPVKSVLLGFMRLLCVAGYKAADLLTPCNLYNQRWEVRCGADPEIMETVYNGVDPARFPAAGAEPAVPTLSWAGRVDPIKDLETLIRAFAMVREKVPEAKLRLFGGTPAGGERYKTRCEDLARDLGVLEHTSFEGRVDDIKDAYAAGTVVVLSSISEGFPYTLIEAMTCGRVTVSTDVGGVTEAIADTGLVVPPRQPRQMADACLRLLGDEMSRRRLGRAARERALELFTVDRAVDSFRAIYDGLVAADGTERCAPAEAEARLA
ncbi:DUF3492 domain-containing protein [Actinomadura decatromicini]|uniref:DUF3492 domain-containing protein n=1 Tax=Actinomadura decatromicini TaxID=2604572 RepID=A0A5D3FX95_9ACTN|nr:DUF3492 domain-containing protein [Actinomadura decatromicini]